MRFIILTYIFLYLFLFDKVTAQDNFFFSEIKNIPADLALPIVTHSNNPSEGYIFASVPYWGNGNHYIVIYNLEGKPVYYKKTSSLCTDFKLNKNGLITYFDYAAKKFFAMDFTMNVVDSFWVQNRYTTDEHDIKFLSNGNVILIGLEYKIVDMSKFIAGGNTSASVVVNVIQEINPSKEVVFEWKSDEHYKYTDAGSSVNLLDVSFVHAHINSIDVDQSGYLLISARNLNEISKIDRTTGEFIWRLGGKNNQFEFINDSSGFSAQHSVNVLDNGNILVYDNGLERSQQYSRAAEYKIDDISKKAELVWSYRNNPDVISKFWGNVQRLNNGNTFISWGFNNIAATELNSNNEKVYEIEFTKDVYSYRIFKFNINESSIVSVSEGKNEITTTKLLQNYPNPFNPSTEISWHLNISCSVKLVIFDMLGKEIAILVNQFQTAGNHKVNFNISNYAISSGIYFYVLITGNNIHTKKMILLK